MPAPSDAPMAGGYIWREEVTSNIRSDERMLDSLRGLVGQATRLEVARELNEMMAETAGRIARGYRLLGMRDRT